MANQPPKSLPSAIVIVSIGAVCLALIYAMSGALLGTFRTDEIYYLASSYAVHMESYPRDPLFTALHAVLVRYWHFIDGDVQRIWTIRLMALPLVAIQLFVLFLIFRELLAHTSGPSPVWALVPATMAIVIVAAYRGYEVRPEIIANTAFIGATWLSYLFFRRSFSPDRQFSVALFAGLGFILAGSFSYRHGLPSLVLISTLIITQWQRSRWYFAALCGTLWVIFAGYLNFGLYDIIVAVRESAAIQGGRVPLSILDKLTLEPTLSLVLKFALIIECIALALFARRGRLAMVPGHPRGLTLTVLGALGSYYLFLLAFDAKPYQYVLSIEFFILVCLVLFTFTSIHVRALPLRHRCLVWIIPISYIAVSASLAIANLSELRSPTAAVSGLAASMRNADLYQLDDVQVVRRMVSTDSMIDQARARAIYCERHPNGKAIVYAYIFHPICMADAGSRAMAGWGGTIDLSGADLRSMQYVALSHRRDVENKAADLRYTHWKIGDIFIRKPVN